MIIGTIAQLLPLQAAKAFHYVAAVLVLANERASSQTVPHKPQNEPKGDSSRTTALSSMFVPNFRGDSAGGKNRRFDSDQVRTACAVQLPRLRE
jgi:hypothetical protein